WLERAQPLDQLADTGLVVRELPLLTTWADRNIERGLADIDTNIGPHLVHAATLRGRNLPPGSTLPCRYGPIKPLLMARATVRVRHRLGEATALGNGLEDLELRGLHRRMALHPIGGTPISHTRGSTPGPLRWGSRVRTVERTFYSCAVDNSTRP